MDNEIIENFFSAAETDVPVKETSEQTIGRVLGAYDLGRKLRELRLRKKIALSDLAKHTGLSPSMLSQLENGKLVPTLPTLARIAIVFDVGLDHFFMQRRGKRMFVTVSPAERMRFPERPDRPKPAYFFECLAFAVQEKAIDAFMAEFPPRRLEEVAEHMHPGSEFVHVLEGTLVIRFEDEDHTMCAGDSVYFDSSGPHSYRAPGPQTARALVVTAPPRI